MEILFITNIPSPYRVEFFNELGKNYDLTVLFEKRTSKERDKSWEEYNFINFKGVFLKGFDYKADMSICFDVIKYIRAKKYDVIICSNFTTPTGIIAVEYMKQHGISYYLESDGGFPKSGDGLKEGIKRRVMTGAKGYFSTSDIHSSYYLAYGAKEDAIIKYPFSSIKENQILSQKISKERKRELKEKLEMKEEKIVLAVGQFIPRKGFDVLIESARKSAENIGFYFVGGTPTEEYLELKEAYGLKNLHFVGFKKPEELREYYKAVDIFVLPTREDIWGLVINEAMAYGLPVVTTNKCLAGVEMIRQGVNGYIVDIENADELKNAVERIFSDSVLYENMCDANLKTAQMYTIETMVKRHLEVLENEERSRVNK